MPSSSLPNVTRPQKAVIATAICGSLVARQTVGPAEQALDAFIPVLNNLVGRLSHHVTGNVIASAARETGLAVVAVADDNVDTLLRHLVDYLGAESLRRTGSTAVLAQGLLAAAFPDGLAHIDDRIVEENAFCRASLAVLQDPANADALTAIKLPPSWITDFACALDASDAAINHVINARGHVTEHVASGQNAENDWVDTMVRLRRYVASRASRTEKARVEEGQSLLRPLTDELRRLRALSAARATKKRTEAEKSTSPTAVSEPAPAAPVEVK